MPEHHTQLEGASTQQTGAPRGYLDCAKATGSVILHHVVTHTGVGIVCSVAYFDPGSWGVDLQAGSQYGYRLLFVVLLAGIFAVILQTLASRLGCVTGIGEYERCPSFNSLFGPPGFYFEAQSPHHGVAYSQRLQLLAHLASHCRLLLHSQPKHTLSYRWLGLYPLYVLSEVAIVATNVSELLGSAIALCLLFPKLQLWHSVLVTACDVVLILAFRNPLRGTPVRIFEILIGILVLIILVCIVVIICKVQVNWGMAFDGFVPSKYVFGPGTLYASVGILGATVMPHSLYLGSALAMQNRISPVPKSTHLLTTISHESSKSSIEMASLRVPLSRYQRVIHATQGFLVAPFRTPAPSAYSAHAQRYEDRENNAFDFVSTHIYHGMVDMVVSLLGFAVIINSLILILASAVFYYGSGSNGSGGPASLFDAYDLIQQRHGAATIFAIGLLASGQSASLIATVAGQAVSEGFLNWRVSPALRRIITRLLAIIPSMTFAIVMGRSGVNTLLVASQVVLSVTLPFIVFPLIYLTSLKSVMSVLKPRVDSSLSDESTVEEADDDIVDFSNGWMMTVAGIVIWLIIVAANTYVLIDLAMGQGG